MLSYIVFAKVRFIFDFWGKFGGKFEGKTQNNGK